MPYQNWPLLIYWILLRQELLQLATAGLFLGSKSTGNKASHPVPVHSLILVLVPIGYCCTSGLTSL